MTPEEREALDRRKIENRLKSGEFVVNSAGLLVCSFCGGNCGQCGYTYIIGCHTPASMDVMVQNL